jgi:hypothetical protein
MEPTVVFLVIAIIVRILLDLSSIARPSYVFDACYAVLFLAVGLAEFVMGGYALFGYASIVLAIVSSLLGFYRYRRRRAPPLKDDRTIPGNSDTMS